MSGCLESQRGSAGVCAVVVTYRPAGTVTENLRAMLRECGRLVVVDNGSSESSRALVAAVEGVEVIPLIENQGIASALNRGMECAAAAGFEWVVTFDQDSLPEPGMVAALLETARRDIRTAMIGPVIHEDAMMGRAGLWLRRHRRLPLFFERVSTDGRDLPDVTMVITSGALTSVRAWREIGGFDEKLFIDYVDTDFCLRLRSAGWRVAVSSRARLVHHLGNREVRKLMGRKFFPTHHSPLRHYYIARNRILMIGRHAWRHPHWMMFECFAVLMWTFRVLAFERERRVKFIAMAMGTRDGLRGRFGVCSERVRARLGA